MDYLIVFLFGMLFAYIVMVTLAVRQKLKELTDTTLETKIPLLVTEKHEDQLLLFNKENNSFVSQASTFEELVANTFMHRNIKVAFIAHNKKLFMVEDGKIVK